VAVEQSISRAGWDELVVIDRSVPEPLHGQLARGLRQAIVDGRVPVGDRLPASRALAAELGCSRWVVTEAYAQLAAEGWLEGRTGSATRVRDAGAGGAPARFAPRPAPVPVRYDLAPGLPDLRAFPRRRWLDAVRVELATLPFDDLRELDPAGDPRLRRAVSAHLGRVRGAVVTADDVLVLPGVRAGVHLVATALRAAGAGLVAVEDPGWPRLRDAIRAAGLEPLPVPVDEDGLRVDLLPRDGSVRAVVTAPAHQYPTGTVLTPDRRAQLVSWARSVDGVVVEDDYDSEFRYDRRPSGVLQALAPEHVVLLGSVSKTLAPALATGWLVAQGEWRARIASALASPVGPGLIDQLALASFVESGQYDRHLRAARLRFRRRRDALLAALAVALPRAEVSGSAAGLHLLLRLPDGTDPVAVVAAGARRGLRLSAAAPTAVRARSYDTCLILGYGNLADAAVEAAVRMLVESVRDTAVPLS
jgi:GntR family transcriptional regulator/MocR family aminotransferase